jgi:hypothetical protein
MKNEKSITGSAMDGSGHRLETNNMESWLIECYELHIGTRHEAQ